MRMTPTKLIENMIVRHFFRGLSTSQNLHKSVKVHSKGKGSSSHDWLARQLSDPYVEKAKRLNYRCRSAFKLLEIDERFGLFNPGQIVIDCGAAPGSWTQVAVKKVNADNSVPNLAVGKVLSIDKQQMYPVQGAAMFGNMDFTDPKSREKIIEALDGQRPNVVISDMAPNATGVREMDNENIIGLCYAVLRFAVQISELDASLLVKLWQCGHTKQLENDIGKFYKTAKVVKPASSRADSAEIFLLGRNFKGLKTQTG